jgi:hypothetical protein
MNDELGASPIGNYLRDAVHWNLREVDLERGLAELVTERTSRNSMSRRDAESLGAKCAQTPSSECSYSGEISYRLNGLPQDSPHQGKRTVVNIQVRFSHLKPQEISVHKDEREISDE